MPRTITISDRAYRRVIAARDGRAAEVGRRVTITEIVDLAFDKYDQAKATEEGTDQK